MSFQARAQYEFGDPVAEQITRDERTDHHHATARGQRLLRLADHLVAALQASCTVTNVAAARAEIFHVLADDLYGNAAINTPDFTNEQSLDAMRRGRSA
jgi:hypothetical protein